MVLNQQGASLFQLAHHHDVYSTVNEYLRARVVLVVRFVIIVLT